MTDYINTFWQHKKLRYGQENKPVGKVVQHVRHNGRVVLRLSSGLMYRGRIRNLKKNWVKVNAHS